MKTLYRRLTLLMCPWTDRYRLSVLLGGCESTPAATSALLLYSVQQRNIQEAGNNSTQEAGLGVIPSQSSGATIDSSSRESRGEPDSRASSR